jgi:hypothetical protein
MGDLNAKVRKDTPSYERIMGKHELGPVTTMVKTDEVLYYE